MKKYFLCGLMLCWPALGSDDWRYWGGDPGGTRFSPLKQINIGNVATLRRAWTFHTGEVTPGAYSSAKQRISAFETTPLLVNGILYATTASSRVIALEPETGNKIWEYDPQAGHALNIAAADRKYNVNRGASYWEGG